MEKAKIYIIKSPIISALITFILALIISLTFSVFKISKHAGLEHTLIPIAFSFAFIYGFNIKEQMSKTYRLKYSLICTIPYLLVGLFAVYHDPVLIKLGHTNWLFLILLAPFITMTASIYFLSGFISKKFSDPEYQNRLIAQKNMPNELKNKRNIVGWFLVIIMALPLIYLYLTKNQIIKVSSETTLLLSTLFFVSLFITVKYLYNTKPKP